MIESLSFLRSAGISMPRDFDPNVTSFMWLPRDLWGDEFAHLLAAITLNWGRIEHNLYLILLAIDTKSAARWTKEFYTEETLQKRKTAARVQVKTTMAKSYPP